MLTRQMQIQAIVNALGGQKSGLDLDSFDRAARAVYEDLLKVRDAPVEERAEALAKSIQEHSGTQWIAQAIGEIMVQKTLECPSLADIAPILSPIEWLWPGWIPKGMLSLLGAVAGAGKSYVALDLARRILDEDVFPDGAPVPTQEANVLYVDAEGVPQVINQRAQEWQMDRHRLFLMYPTAGEMIDLSHPHWRDQLIKWVSARQPALVVVDSLSDANAKSENSVQSVRKILGFLNRLAFDYRCSVLLIHHLRKRGTPGKNAIVTLNDFRGSSHIGAVPRSVLGLSVVQTGPAPERNAPRRLEILKTNLAREPEPLGVQFVPLPSGGVRLEYGDAPEPYHTPTKLELCVDWLSQVLREAEAPIKPKDVVALGDLEDFNRRMVYRARNALGTKVRDTAHKNSPQNAWGWAASDADET